jgi:hypothetical protein
LQDACQASQEFLVDNPSPPTTVVAQVAAESKVQEPELIYIGIPHNSRKDFTAKELEAVSLACGFKHLDAEMTLAVCSSLPNAVVTEQVELYRRRPVSDPLQNVEEIKPHQRTKYGLGYRRNFVEDKACRRSKIQCFF